MLGSLATKALPFLTKTILPNLATGALSVVGNVLGQKATKAAVGNGLYLKKGAGKIMQVETDGQGLYLKPYEGSGFGKVGNGLYHKQSSNIYDGSGRLLGNSSPFKNIPVLGMVVVNGCKHCLCIK